MGSCSWISARFLPWLTPTSQRATASTTLLPFPHSTATFHPHQTTSHPRALSMMATRPSKRRTHPPCTDFRPPSRAGPHQNTHILLKHTRTPSASCRTIFGCDGQVTAGNFAAIGRLYPTQCLDATSRHSTERNAANVAGTGSIGACSAACRSRSDSTWCYQLRREASEPILQAVH